jgi:hypothetical protein
MFLNEIGRASFVVTPIAHVEHFNDLSDPQLLALYADCFAILEEEAIAAGIASSAPEGQPYPTVTFEQMVVTLLVPSFLLVAAVSRNINDNE